MKKIYFITMLLMASMVQLNAQVWTAITVPSPLGITDLLVANNKLYYTASNGVYSSTDGIVWDSSSSGMTLNAGLTYSLNIYNYNNTLYSGGSLGRLYKSIDYGANWTQMPGVVEQFTTPDITALFFKGDTIVAGLSKSLGIRKTYDGGTTWTSTGAAASFAELVAAEIVELNNAIYVRTLKGIFKSTDMATSFTKLTGGLPAFSGSVGSLVENNAVLISAIYLIGLYMSSDYGVTWTEIIPVGGPTTTYSNNLQVESGYIYMTFTGGIIYRSADNGTTWTDFTGTGIVGNVHYFAVFNGDLYAGGGGGLYKTPLGASVNENTQGENSISMYPNPVRDILTISSEENFKDCLIKMYNITGELLLENSVDADNRHNIDMTNYSNGIYFIEVKQDKSISRQKVIKN